MTVEPVHVQGTGVEHHLPVNRFYQKLSKYHEAKDVDSSHVSRSLPKSQTHTPTHDD